MSESYSKLEAQLADARAEIAWLREATAPVLKFCMLGPGFSRSESVVLYALITATGLMTDWQLRRVWDIAMGRFGEVSDPGHMKVTVCRLRKRLAAQDPPIAIITVWGFGYRMDDANKALARKLIVEYPVV